MKSTKRMEGVISCKPGLFIPGRKFTELQTRFGNGELIIGESLMTLTKHLQPIVMSEDRHISLQPAGDMVDLVHLYVLVHDHMGGLATAILQMDCEYQFEVRIGDAVVTLVFHHYTGAAAYLGEPL